MWLLSISYGSGMRPYEYACQRTYVELACTYDASDGTFQSTVGITGSLPLVRTVNRTVRFTDPLVSTEDLSEELNFTLRQESVLENLTALRLGGTATLFYSCQITKSDCSMTCALGPHSAIFSGDSVFTQGESTPDQMIEMCRKASNTSSFHSGTFLGRWMRICERIRSLPTKDYGSLDFRYGDDSSLATCSLCSAPPIKFRLRIQAPTGNTTVFCHERSDPSACCSLASDIRNVTNLRAMRCCTSSSLTRHHCVTLRKAAGDGLSTVDLEGIERAFEGSRVVVPIVFSLSVVVVAAIVVTIHKRLGLHLPAGHAGRSRFRIAYRSASPPRRSEGLPPDLKRSD